MEATPSSNKTAEGSPATKDHPSDPKPAVVANATPLSPIAEGPRSGSRSGKSNSKRPAPAETGDSIDGRPDSTRTRPAQSVAVAVANPKPAAEAAELRSAKSVPYNAQANAQTSAAAAVPTARVTESNRYPWRNGIVTTIFWIGEPVGGHNFTPNYASSWDAHWTRAYGGLDTPDPNARRNYVPARFVPQQNPFYIALPYNDVTRGTTKPEARRAIPWFKAAFEREGQSVCKDRWVAIRNRAGKVAYAQWSDCGPFRTDHWQYVFGNERPKPNLNGGAGLDVSPAVRDFLDLQSTDVTDWKFVELREVPNGPWALYGQNNVLAMRGSRGSKGFGKEKGNVVSGATRIRVKA